MEQGEEGSASNCVSPPDAACSKSEMSSYGRKRKGVFDEGKKNKPLYKRRHPERTKCFNPFNMPNLLEADLSKFGSVAKEIQKLCALMRKVSNGETDTSIRNAKSDSTEGSNTPNQQLSSRIDDHAVEDASIQAPLIIILDSDEEEDEIQEISSAFQETASKNLTKEEPPITDSVVVECTDMKAEKEEQGSLAIELGIGEEKSIFVDINPPKAQESVKDKTSDKEHESPARKITDSAVERYADMKDDQSDVHVYHGENEIMKNKGAYVGVLDDDQYVTENEEDGLAGIWKEMTYALESSKDITRAPSYGEHVREIVDDCEHSFILKDDLGEVCRICGIVQRPIHTILEFHYSKMTRTRTYARSEFLNKVGRDPANILQCEEEPMETIISVHPRHMKQMKSHQVEGFNFLLQNLVTESPGGCILAHAPGSGKTFMIISFLQSFLAKYPMAKPLIILPKGLLETWKREFQRWQIEDTLLLDLYSVKADNRSQQLVVLEKWIQLRSILFLGYKQFTSIVCCTKTCQITAHCQKILLDRPSILIMDEGHTPRNEDTDTLQSIAKVRTLRKVVLSGTLYQNHVKEVFNILNLVRPKFLKSETSRGLVNRIMSKVVISKPIKQLKLGGESAFYDLVEDTLQKDENYTRKISVIQDLREMTAKVLHYYKGDFLEELPGHIDFTVLLNISAKQKPEVEKLKKLDIFRRNSVGSIVYLHPGLKALIEKGPIVGNNGSSVNDDKIDYLLKKLNFRDGVKTKFFLNMLDACELAGEKLLVFSQYLLPLKFLERLAVGVKGWSPGKETFVISGETNSDLREQSMERFNGSTDAKVFFGSIKACGEGISLVGASRILILDVHLNPSVTRQAIGRAFRPGQKKKVYTYRLVAADSPEEEDHSTCFRKEIISKMWFEWNEYCDYQYFKMRPVDVNRCDDVFLEGGTLLGEDIKALHKR